MERRNKLYDSSFVKSAMEASLSGLGAALAKALDLKPGEKIRIVDTPAKTHRIKDIHPDNPYWKGYQAQQARFRALEQAEADAQQRRVEEWRQRTFGPAIVRGL